MLEGCCSCSAPLYLAAVPALDGDCSLVYLMDEPVQRTRLRTRKGPHIPVPLEQEAVSQVSRWKETVVVAHSPFSPGYGVEGQPF